MPLKENSLIQRAVDLERQAEGISHRLHDIAEELGKMLVYMPGDNERAVLALLIKSIRTEIHNIHGR